MHLKRICYSMTLILPLLTGCALLGRAPTPVPYIYTTPHGTQPSPDATLFSTAIPSQPTPTSPPATLQPTQVPTLAPTDVAQAITLEQPRSGDIVGNPVTVRGNVALTPFENTLVARVYDAKGQLAAEAPIMTRGDLGGPATFQEDVPYGGVPGAGRIEIVDISPRDGAVIASASAYVTLRGFPGSGYVETPAPLARVTMPLHILARVGNPGQQIHVTVKWQDGTQFAQPVITLTGQDGRGLIITTLDWAQPPQSSPATQTGYVQIHDVNGQQLAQQPLTFLHPEDPDTIATNVYWVVQEEVVAQHIRIPRTLGVGRASLNALLWGPAHGNPQAYTTALPTPEDILSYPGRGPAWGERVRLKDLRIVDSVAYADFSGEILAHHGGATQVLLMRAQIEQTLLQFSTVSQVVITVEGQLDMLEP